MDVAMTTKFSACKCTCADVVRIQTRNDFHCFPSLTIAPVHYFYFYINLNTTMWDIDSSGI